MTQTFCPTSTCRRRCRWIAGLAALLILSPAGSGQAQTTAPASLPADANTTCPVMPEEMVDPELYVDHNGRRIYLCCTMCRRNFAKNPEKYLHLLNPGGTSSPTSETTGTLGADDGQSTRPVSAFPDTDSGSPGQDQIAGTAETSMPETPATAPDSSTLEKAARYTGRLHAVSVHFPIGLLLGAAAVEAVAVIRRRPIGSEGARLTLGLGTASAVVAAPLGWLNAAFSNHPGLEHYVEWHRWLGTAAAAAAVAAWALARGARTGNRTLEKAYLTTLFAGSILLILTGHFGASLIYGPDYLVP